MCSTVIIHVGFEPSKEYLNDLRHSVNNHLEYYNLMTDHIFHTAQVCDLHVYDSLTIK